jgi:hypothetical protein
MRQTICSTLSNLQRIGLALVIFLIPCTSASRAQTPTPIPPFIQLGNSLNACGSPDFNCNNPPGSFHVGDDIHVKVLGYSVEYTLTTSASLIAALFMTAQQIVLETLNLAETWVT